MKKSKAKVEKKLPKLKSVGEKLESGAKKAKEAKKANKKKTKENKLEAKKVVKEQEKTAKVAEKASKDLENSEAKYAKLLANPDKLKDDDIRKIIRTSLLHFKEAHRILESRKAERKLNKKLSA